MQEKVNTPIKWKNGLSTSARRALNNQIALLKLEAISEIKKPQRKKCKVDRVSDKREAISPIVKREYAKWRTENKEGLTPIKPESLHPKVNAENLLQLLSLMEKEQKVRKTEKLKQCIAQHTFNHAEAMWGLPTHLALAVRQCILHRKWDQMTGFLLLLLQHFGHTTRYYVRDMCRVMMKHNPRIKELGLLEQFESATKTKTFGNTSLSDEM